MADGRWATTCPTCKHRYAWTGPMAPTPPCPQCVRRLQAEQPKQPARLTRSVTITHEPSESAQEAFELCDEIESMAGDVCEAGEDYAASVCQTTSGIRTTVEQNNRATDGQISALENMKDGLSRWIHD